MAFTAPTTLPLLRVIVDGAKSGRGKLAIHRYSDAWSAVLMLDGVAESDWPEVLVEETPRANNRAFVQEVADEFDFQFGIFVAVMAEAPAFA